MVSDVRPGNVNPFNRSIAFGPPKVIKKTTGLYKSKRFHFQLTFIFSIAIVSLIFGIIYFDKCSIQPRIPLFLVVQGSAGILLLLIHVVATFYILCITKFKYYFITFVAFTSLLILLFSCVWFVVGNVWVFSVARQVQYDDQTKKDSYCDRTLYQAAFWIIIVQYILSVYFLCSLTWIPQSSASPTNGVIKIRKQIPKIRRILFQTAQNPRTIERLPEARL